MVGDNVTRYGTSRRQLLYGGAVAAVTGLFAGCSGVESTSGAGAMSEATDVTHDVTTWDRYDSGWKPPTDAPAGSFDIEILAERLEIPWDLAFSPSGELFVTERTGRVVTLDAGEMQTIAEPADIIDAEAIEPGSDDGSWLVPGREGGLLGIAVHPTYPDPPLVYVYYTAQTDDGRRNRVVAFDTTASDPAEASWPIVDGIPADTYHNGGRIAFGPAKYLWIATGDADAPLETTERTRDTGSLAGKTLRVRPDGSAPESNPDIGSDADPRVYTYGHRNPQGISWLPDGTPVITEHGPGGGDEINVLRAGEDYGWPVARNSGDFDPYTETSYRPPVADADSWAPAGSVFYTGDTVPALKNRLLYGGLISQQIIAATIAPAEGKAPKPDHETVYDGEGYDGAYHAATTAFFGDELGRVRHVEQGPEGALYAITSNRDGRAGGNFPRDRDDVLVRITPA